MRGPSPRVDEELTQEGQQQCHMLSWGVMRAAMPMLRVMQCVCGSACVALHYSVSAQHVCKLELCYQAGLPGKACTISDGGRLDFSDLLSVASSSVKEVSV